MTVAETLHSGATAASDKARHALETARDGAGKALETARDGTERAVETVRDSTGKAVEAVREGAGKAIDTTAVTAAIAAGSDPFQPFDDALLAIRLVDRTVQSTYGAGTKFVATNRPLRLPAGRDPRQQRLAGELHRRDPQR